MTTEEKKKLFFKKNDAIVKRKLTEKLKRKLTIEDYEKVLVTVKEIEPL